VDSPFRPFGRRQSLLRNRQFRHFCDCHVKERGYGIACLKRVHREDTVMVGSFVQNHRPHKQEKLAERRRQTVSNG
jgi:hypothetical protein